MQKLFLSILAFFARIIILAKKPFVIGITGTVGKTTISTHIARFLAHEYGEQNVRISPYHYNGEFGLPLSIIGAKSGGKNPIIWLGVFLIAIFALFRKYPRYIILEYGIDHPGEMDFLVSIVRPDIAIISPVTPNHLEQFGTLKRYRSEKLILAQSTRKLIAHESLRQYIDREALYYSTGGMSDIDASHMQLSVDGVSAHIHVKESDYTIHIPAFGAYQVENILPVYAVAHILGIDPSKIAQYGHEFLPEPGRSSILSGKEQSVIIDGTYNGGYEALMRGIDSVVPFLSTHRIFFLFGDMRELGEHTRDIHESLAEYILEKIPKSYKVEFFLVGPYMQKYVLPKIQSEYRVTHSLSSRSIGKIIAHAITSRESIKTILYAKGSQNTIFLEEALKFCLSSQGDVKHLCRQSSEWMKKKNKFFSQFENQ